MEDTLIMLLNHKLKWQAFEAVRGNHTESERHRIAAETLLEALETLGVAGEFVENREAGIKYKKFRKSA